MKVLGSTTWTTAIAIAVLSCVVDASTTTTGTTTTINQTRNLRGKVVHTRTVHHHIPQSQGGQNQRDDGRHQAYAEALIDPQRTKKAQGSLRLQDSLSPHINQHHRVSVEGHVWHEVSELATEAHPKHHYHVSVEGREWREVSEHSAAVNPNHHHHVSVEGHEWREVPKKDHPHHVTVLGRRSHGEMRSVDLDLKELEGKVPRDEATFTKNHQAIASEDNHKSGNVRGGQVKPNQEPVKFSPSLHPEGHLRSSSSPTSRAKDHDAPTHHRADHEIQLDAVHRSHHFEGHVEVERHHEHHYHPHHNSNDFHHDQHHRQHHVKYEDNRTSFVYNEEEDEEKFDWKRDREIYKLPTGLASHFNETLFNELHDAPFRVYKEALGHALGEGESFPVFALPQWMNTTGVFTGFSKSATPLIFENVQFLLHWEEIISAVNSPIDRDLKEHITNNNFRASLIIGKSIGNGANVPFIGMVVCYYQFGNPKNVLVPFSKLEDFFDDTSEKHLLDPKTKSQEMAALHNMLEQKRTNSSDSNFYHPALAHTEERQDKLENLEVIHFQKLFQLLIRRSFLFSLGYADCLLNEPHGLRDCLDDTFYDVIKLETNVRGALDDQIVEQLAEINETFHSKVSEACISVQGVGSGMIYGSGSCYNTYDLGAFAVGNFGSF